MRILLVQTSFLGDTILSTPVIGAIKSVFPESELWMMTTPLSADFVQRDPLLKGVIPFDKRNRDKGLYGSLRVGRKLKSMRFDRVYSLHRSLRTSLLLWFAGIPLRIGCSDAKGRCLYHRLEKRNLDQHDVVRNMSILSGELELDAESMEMRLFPPALDEIRTELRARLPSPGRYAVVAPGSAWRTKMWHWEGFRQVVEHLLMEKLGVVLIGAESEQAVCSRVGRGLPVVDLCGRTRLAEIMSIVRHACLMVCNDSMPLHMASALHVPTVVIFCATSPGFGYGPWKNRAMVVEQEGLPCKPCRRHGSDRCPNGSEACMRGPGAGVVIDAVRRLLDPPKRIPCPLGAGKERV
jgi:heptosyltransferase II